MRLANWHTYQVLTKRSERMRDLLQTRLRDAADEPHIWWGVSVENRRHGLPRIEHLRESPARVRFLSVEPLLEDLGPIDLDGIDWVIVGGESGHGARPMDAAGSARSGTSAEPPASPSSSSSGAGFGRRSTGANWKAGPTTRCPSGPTRWCRVRRNASPRSTRSSRCSLQRDEPGTEVTVPLQMFGGDWTDEKLRRVEKYLKAYNVALKKQPFTREYIDAFAGTGYREVKQPDSQGHLLLPELVEEDCQDFVDGSARIALKVEPPFHKLTFIERNPEPSTRNSASSRNGTLTGKSTRSGVTRTIISAKFVAVRGTTAAPCCSSTPSECRFPGTPSG